MTIGANFQANFGMNLFQQFGWAGQVGQFLSQPSAVPLGGSFGLNALADRFGGIQSHFGSSWNVQHSAGFSAMPDFANAGHLGVDKNKGVVTTPGGYQVKVNNGQVQIKAPNGKFTNLKAEPPNRTVTKDVTSKETRTRATTERVLPRDPAVRESDGDVWRYQGTGSFSLPDGTKITIQEKGKDTDLHINRVDVYNGNKHVGIDSKLTSHSWKTHKRTSQRIGTGDWQTTNSNRRWEGRRLVRRDTQQRSVTNRITEEQHADQKFKTTFSDVKNDGFLHDAMTDDGFKFRAAGDGDDWKMNGREVISGAGKGKDDKTKAFKLGGNINTSWQGYRPLHVPWKGYAYNMTNITRNMFSHHYGMNSNHWNRLGNMFCGMQHNPYMGVMTNVSNMGGFNSIFGGPMGGAALYGRGFRDGFNARSQLDQMLGSVGNMLPLFDRSDLLSFGLRNQLSMNADWALQARAMF